ncbi:hypothetical protein Bbelb_060990 [Branchiostoma belcheri]|nr:hypothetical protein Bbelb_060990 [Branchiostoma belcheri]
MASHGKSAVAYCYRQDKLLLQANPGVTHSSIQVEEMGKSNISLQYMMCCRENSQTPDVERCEDNVRESAKCKPRRVGERTENREGIDEKMEFVEDSIRHCPAVVCELKITTQEADTQYFCHQGQWAASDLNSPLPHTPLNSCVQPQPDDCLSIQTIVLAPQLRRDHRVTPLSTPLNRPPRTCEAGSYDATRDYRTKRERRADVRPSSIALSRATHQPVTLRLLICALRLALSAEFRLTDEWRIDGSIKARNGTRGCRIVGKWWQGETSGTGLEETPLHPTIIIQPLCQLT